MSYFKIHKFHWMSKKYNSFPLKAHGSRADSFAVFISCIATFSSIASMTTVTRKNICRTAVLYYAIVMKISGTLLDKYPQSIWQTIY